VIICAVLASLAAIPLPCFPKRTAGRSSAGAQIITGDTAMRYLIR
jgi:hypothetical protein